MTARICRPESSVPSCAMPGTTGGARSLGSDRHAGVSANPVPGGGPVMHVRREGLFAALLLTAVGGAATAQVPQAPAVAPRGTPAPVSVSPRPTGIDRLTRLAVPADPAELSPSDPVPPVPARSEEHTSELQHI